MNMHAPSVILAASLSLAFSVTSTARAQSYTIREVLPVTGDGATYAWDVNNNGITLGVCDLPETAGTQTVFYDDQGFIASISAPANLDSPFIWGAAINDANTFVGMEIGFNPPLGTTSRTFVSSLDLIPDRFLLFVPTGPAGATDINDASPPFSVGHTDIGQTHGQHGVYHAFLVKTDGQNNPITDLGTLGGFFSRAEALNETGDAVGFSLTANGPLRAFLAPKGSAMINLGTLGGVTSRARDINNAKVVVGWSRLADGSTSAFQWKNGAMSALGRLDGNYSEANAINTAGVIVGMAHNASHWPRAVRFAPDGAAIDLNNLIPPGTGWTLQYAQGVNDAGVIVGWGRINGQTRGFILTPCAPDCDLSGALSIDDFICFQTLFALADPASDCDQSASLTIEDFICFQTLFAIGC